MMSGDVAVDAAVIQTSALGKVFIGASGLTEALRNVTLTVKRGAFTCLLGPSGCGKSTLLRIMAGLDHSSSGTCEVQLPQDARPSVVFQGGGLFPWRTVTENVTFALQMKGVGKAERRTIAAEWLAIVGLAPFARAYPHQLSGGMRQRVAIARAFATGEELLLMDEPLGALDAQTRALMQEQLLDLWQGHRKTVVFVTHSLEEALLLGDDVVMMSTRPGRISQVIPVPFPRPRDARIVASPEFASLKSSLWEMLRDEVAASMLDMGA